MISLIYLSEGPDSRVNADSLKNTGHVDDTYEVKHNCYCSAYNCNDDSEKQSAEEGTSVISYVSVFYQ